MQNEKKYSIKAVAGISGLTEFVIRAWEKRYNAVTPSRTDANRRVYSPADIEKLKLLHQATTKGHSIGNIADLNIDSLKELIGMPASNDISVKKDNGSNFDPLEHIDICIDAIQKLDAEKLETELLKASISLSQPELIEKLLIPLLEKTGQNWEEGKIRVINEHLASTIIGSFLFNLIDNYKIPNTAPKILFTTPMGQQHEFGALLASAVAAYSGWKAVYLGANLPIVDFINAAERMEPKAIAMSIIYPQNDPQLKIELLKLKLLNKDIIIFVGGRAAYSYIEVLDQINALLVKDLNEFQNKLISLSAR
ncbi:MAG: MerR family transcriptional regulator [Ignavibacteriaceae bacterium]